MGAKRFRIAFSFAGEKREFVEKVAGLLAQSFGEEAILYDKFHEAEFARARLGRYLPKLYNEQSDLVVVVICRDYVGKEWCGLEWDAIFDLLKQRRESEVMLSRFDYAIVDGPFSDAGFSELDHKTAEQFAALILERLALNEGKPKDYYTKPSSAGSKVSRTSISNKQDQREELKERLDVEDRQYRKISLAKPDGKGQIPGVRMVPAPIHESRSRLGCLLKASRSAGR
jgi:hypothetical protein